MQENTSDAAQQRPQSPSAPNKSLRQRNLSNRINILGVALVVVVLLVAAYFVFFKNAGSSNLSGSIPTSLKNSTTTVPSNSSLQNVSSGGGAGQHYMSRSEVVSLMGAGGKYSASYMPNPGQQYGFLSNNLTDYWMVSYTMTSNTTLRLLMELAYQSPKAHYLYTAQLGQLLVGNKTVGAFNAASNGLTYSYVRWVTGSVRGSELSGYKNDEFVDIVSPYELNQTALASVIAGDIP